MRFEVYSPGMPKIGDIGDVMPVLRPVAEEVVRNPRYLEEGRSSWLTRVGEDKGSMLDNFAHEIGREYLGRSPRPGSRAVLSVVTNPTLFRQHTRRLKLASHWHQESRQTPQGLTKVAGLTLNIAHAVGSMGAEGNLVFDRAVQMEARDMPKEEAQAAGPVVFGPDGVLIKSEPDPQGGQIYQAGPGVYLLPRDAVHKATDTFPDGRIFFQMDAWE